MVFLFGNRLNPLGHARKFIYILQKKSNKDQNDAKSKEPPIFDYLSQKDLKFSSISKEDNEKLNEEIGKVKNVISNYLIDV